MTPAEFEKIKNRVKFQLNPRSIKERECLKLWGADAHQELLRLSQVEFLKDREILALLEKGSGHKFKLNPFQHLMVRIRKAYGFNHVYNRRRPRIKPRQEVVIR